MARPAPGTHLAGVAAVRWTGTADGDLRTGAPGSDTARGAVVGLPWVVLDQVHGADVVSIRTVEAARRCGDVAPQAGDGMVTDVPGVALAVLTADCAPVALASPEGIIGAAHAGWRGLEAGVIQATVAAMRALGATRIEAALGPCIGPECYRFTDPELERVAAVCGPSVRAVDVRGDPALDVRAGVRSALQGCQAELVADAGACTACGGSWWSWRARRDTARQATVVWRRAA